MKKNEGNHRYNLIKVTFSLSQKDKNYQILIHTSTIYSYSL